MRRTWMAVVLATGLVTTSCGSDRDDDPAAAASTTSSSTTAVEGEGAPGIGDPYFPGLGNGGYDVASYDLAISVDPAAGSLAGVATIEATATEGLTAFNLDLVGLTASAVTVDGEPAATTHAGRELRIEPATPIETGEPFTIEVTYGGQPEPLDSGVSILPDVGWFTDTGFSYVLSEPSGAATWFPSNDHPADKATFTFRIDVPEGIEAAANGTLGSRYTGGGRTTWVWSSDDPMATYLATVVVGELAMDDPVAVGDVVLRNVYAASLADAARDSAFALQPEMLEFFGERLGPYPFDEYGVVVVDAQLGVALETQTLSLFGNDNIGQGDQNGIIVAHELAHQWFGNAVSLAGWQDIWLNEGLATYAEWLWIEHRGQATLDESAAQVYQTLERDGTGDLPPGDPGAEEIFSPSVYGRGALTVYALRAAVGDEALGTILRRWVAVHTGGTATTADFVALAEEVSGAQLGELFDRWLYGPELPPLP